MDTLSPVTALEKHAITPRNEKPIRPQSVTKPGRFKKVRPGAWITHILLLTSAVFMILPFIWMFLSAVKSTDEIFSGTFLSLPEVWHWEHFAEAWQMAPFGRFFLNSFIMSTGVVLGQIITCSMAAYAFAWVPLKGKNLLFILVVASTIVPFESTMIPSYLVIKELGWINSYAGLIAPSLTSVFGIFLLRQFFMTIPRDLMDAARMDGCGHFRTLLQVVLPISKTVLATLSLFAFLHAWNNYLWPLLITNSSEMRTIQVGLRYMMDVEKGIQWPHLMAASTFIIMPVLLFFLFTQKYFVRGVMHSSVK